MTTAGREATPVLDRLELAHRLYFVRHGETDWNRDSRLQGQQDIPLNDHGRGQARRNGVVLREHVDDVARFDFVASPLSRTRETMEIMRAAMGLDPSDYRLDDRLKEITFGEWEGVTPAELKAANPAGHAARRADKWGFAPPGGESYATLSERVRAWAESLSRDSVIVSHGGVSRVLRGMLLPIPTSEIPRLETPQDRVYAWRGGAGGWL